MNVSDLYRTMEHAALGGTKVAAGGPVQPGDVMEAEPFRAYTLDNPAVNVPRGRRTDLRWAAANVLHFFAATEEAEPLPMYNRHAERFLTDGRWLGAYGAVAVPQLRACVELLQQEPASRRAVVSMGGLEHQDVNRPACWCHLHFLLRGGLLHMHVYQRSLNLYGVMPYDCVVLTNVLLWTAAELGAAPGALRWTVGSLHAPLGPAPPEGAEASVVLPRDLLSDRLRCWAVLRDPKAVEGLL